MIIQPNSTSELRGPYSRTIRPLLTRLPSNLRPTTRECMHLVTRDHFRSRDKYGGHTIRYAIAENSFLHANFMVLYFTQL